MCISCDDAEDFKRNFRLQLRAMVDPETRHPLSPEPVFIYVPPQGLDPDAKGPGRVIDAMRRELGSRRRERVARLNPPEPSSSGRPGSPAQGADDVIGCIKEALRASLEARAAAYTEELRRHLGAVSGPQAPAFAELFLLKDSLAVMMEASGLLQDALREYLELDVAFQQAMTASGSANQTEMQLLLPGGSADEAAPMWTTWQHTRHAVLGTAAADASSQLAIRQSLFANEARVLLKLQRHAEVLDRGLTLVEHMASGRTQQTTLQQQHQGRSSRARECWAFAGCISLASVVSTLHAQEAPGGGVHQTPFAASSGAVRSILLPDAGMEGGDGAVHPDFDASEHRSWKLGVLPSDQSMAHTLANGVDRTDAQHVYCLLGQLYCLARELLEAIGAAAGFHPPRFAPSLEAAASCAAGALLHKAEGGAARVVESPRRSRARSLSPSRTSLDRTTLSRSMMSSGVVNGVESGDEGSSLSIHPVRSSLGAGDERLAILDQMQTIDLTAAQAREQHESTAGETEVAAGTSSGAGGPREGQDENGSSAATGTELSLAPETSAALPSMLSTASSSATAGPDQPDLHSPGRLAQQGPETAPAGTERKAEMAPAGPTTVSVHSRKFSEAGSTVSTPRSSTTGPPADSDAGLSPDPSKELGRVPSGGAAASLAEVEAYISGAGGAHRRSTSHNTTRSLNGGETVAGGEGSGAWQGRVHWRIRAALSSQASFTGLWTALSHAAAECFEHGGRRRRALLCHADAADALASQGKFTEAAAIYEAQCRVALREGWLPVALQTLPKLAACQVEVAAPTGLPHTAVALLTLLVNPKKGQSSSQDSAALRSALSLLTSAAALAGAGNNLEYPPLLGPTVSFHGVDLSSILLASPVKGWYCRFYGRSDAAGHPILVPTGPGGAAKARVQLAVGDVAPLVIHVTNPLPAAVQLADLRLVLSGMRQMAGERVTHCRAWV